MLHAPLIAAFIFSSSMFGYIFHVNAPKVSVVCAIHL